MEDGGKIVLLPRPRRFGKTLNMSIIRYFLEKSKEDRKYLFDNLKIEKEAEIMKFQGKFMEFLLLSGYLKVVGKTFDKDIDLYKYKLKIPNIEIRTLYRNIIDKWFKEAEGESDYNNMIEALVLGDIKSFIKIFKRYVLESFSYFDVSGKNPERVYHAFVLGIMVSLTGVYEVLSNRESGLGRYDVCLIPKDKEKLGYIFEFKRYDEEDEETIEETLNEALQQIEDKKYDTELIKRGVKNIVKMAIVFNGKNVHIKRN